MKTIEKGFTLFEVLVSMFIAAVALLALALMEIHILKSSQSSFNYTVATIRANSFVDDVWMDLCRAQSSSASISTYTNIRNDWLDEISAAGMTAASGSPPTSAQQVTSITLSWQDKRFIDDGANNTLTLKAKFPDSGCG